VNNFEIKVQKKMLEKIDQLIRFLEAEYEYLYQFAVKKFSSEMISKEIAECLLFFYTIFDKTKARKKLKNIIKNLPEHRSSEAEIIIKKIREQRDSIAESDRKERYKKYIEDIYSSSSLLYITH
jgi:hypothetical protein